MTRSFKTCAVVLPLIAALGSPLAAEVKTREKTLLKLEGMLGRVVGMFGGKAARDGIVSTSAVKGDRKMTVSDNSGQLVDLNEEKVYEIDFKKKEYKVTTFDEIRERMKEAADRAEQEAERTEQQEAGRDAQEAAKELEVDFDAKETGERKQIAGHEARQVIMTVTVREKGKTVEEGGGFVMINDAWLGPELPALQELAEFDRRYYTKLYGEAAMALAADQMAMVMAMYPMLKKASDRLAQEGDKLKGTPLASTMTFEAVKSKQQLAAASEQKESGGGGLGGMLARKMMKKEEPKARATIFTAQHEFQDVSNSVGATDLEIPAGFKQKK